MNNTTDTNDKNIHNEEGAYNEEGEEDKKIPTLDELDKKTSNFQERFNKQLEEKIIKFLNDDGYLLKISGYLNTEIKIINNRNIKFYNFKEYFYSKTSDYLLIYRNNYIYICINSIYWINRIINDPFDTSIIAMNIEVILKNNSLEKDGYIYFNVGPNYDMSYLYFDVELKKIYPAGYYNKINNNLYICKNKEIFDELKRKYDNEKSHYCLLL